MDNSRQELTCPGSFHVECADNPIEPPYEMDDCECEGQLLVSKDCTTGAWCTPSSVKTINCTEEQEGYILAVDFSNWQWDCVPVRFSFSGTVEIFLMNSKAC